MDTILEVKNLKVAFRTSGGMLKAVRGINFDLQRGKTLAIVGESGSGKSVTSRAIMGILAGNAIVEGGEILYDGKDLLCISEDEMHHIRGDKISMIFQDPLSSLNPIVKIGKQITEAMLLKNKSNRREARQDFNRLLALLRERMQKAVPEQAAHAKELCSTFDNFCIKSTKLETSYNEAVTVVTDLISSIKDFLFYCEKKQNVDVKATLADFNRHVTSLKDPYLTDGHQQQLTKLASELSTARAAYVKPTSKDAPILSDDLVKMVKALLAELEELQKRPRPDFFSIGYYLYRNPNKSFAGMPVPEINTMCEAYLNQEFMDEFRVLAMRAVRYSYNEAMEGKKKVLDALREAEAFYAGSFTKAEADKRCDELSKVVESSIDLLEINKDSVAWTFKTSLSSAIERYFHHVRSNPKEEARFKRQSQRRDRKIAAGKHVTWKVVPKNVYDLDEMKNAIVMVIRRLMKRYEAIVVADDLDEAKRTNDIIEYQKSKASMVVYRITKSMAKEHAIQLMEEVGIHEPRKRFYQYPFEFSGGMRQRIVIAIALAANPDILICDEPTTALDVTIQAQILELINKLKQERNLSIIFITHDLGVVANMADDIAVMYAGKVVEYGTAEDIFYDPRHPYTWALLSSMPDLDTKEKLESIPGTPPNMIYPPVGDAFADRNKYAMQIDFEQEPPMFKVSDTHAAATWLLHPNAPKVEMPAVVANRIERTMKAGGDRDGSK